MKRFLVRAKKVLDTDLNSDGRGDVLVLHGGRRGVSLVNGSSPNMASVRHYALGPLPSSLAVGQLMGDASGPLDVIVADAGRRRDNINGSVWILQGQSATSGGM